MVEIMTATAKTTTIVCAADQPVEFDEAEVEMVSAAAVGGDGRVEDEVVGKTDRFDLEHSHKIADTAGGDAFCCVADVTAEVAWYQTIESRTAIPSERESAVSFMRSKRDGPRGVKKYCMEEKTYIYE